MSDDSRPALQMGMFGVAPAPLDVHRVAAHSRILADGTESFVAEHLRWNRGRKANPGPSRLPKHEAPDPGQLALFGASEQD